MCLACSGASVCANSLPPSRSAAGGLDQDVNLRAQLSDHLQGAVPEPPDEGPQGAPRTSVVAPASQSRSLSPHPPHRLNKRSDGLPCFSVTPGTNALSVFLSGPCFQPRLPELRTTWRDSFLASLRSSAHCHLAASSTSSRQGSRRPEILSPQHSVWLSIPSFLGLGVLSGVTIPASSDYSDD